MKILYVLIVAIVCFILNLIVYYISEDYRNFLKQTKGVEENNIILKDEYKIKNNYEEEDIYLRDSKDIKNSVLKETEDGIAEEELRRKRKVAIIREMEKEEQNLKKKQEKVNRVFKKLEKEEHIKEIVKEKRKEIKQGYKKIRVSKKKVDGGINLSPYDKKFINLFKKYNLVKLEYHGDLLDVTSEYPDKYFEYYTMDLTILVFPTISYKGIKDIFTVESNGYNFMLNEVDNFGEESFYVNMGDDYIDGYIRVIFTKKNRVYGFKVVKSEYSKVKSILKKL